MTNIDPAPAPPSDSAGAALRSDRTATLHSAGGAGLGLGIGSWAGALLPVSWRGPVIAMGLLAFVALLAWQFGTSHGARARARAIDRQRALPWPHEIGATMAGVVVGAGIGLAVGAEVELATLVGMCGGIAVVVVGRRATGINEVVLRERGERRSEDRASARLREQSARDAAWRESQGR